MVFFSRDRSWHTWSSSLLILSLLFSHLHISTSFSFSPPNASTTRALSTLPKETIKIVTYNNIRGFLNWHEEFFFKYISTQCKTNCIFSMDSKDIPDADVVIFLASTFHRNSPLFPKKGKDTTLFVLHTMEQPMYVPMLNDFPYLKQHFDLLAMYSQEPIYPGSGVPNLPLTYYPLHVYEPTAVLSPIKSFSEKNGYGTGDNQDPPSLISDSFSCCLRCSCGDLYFKL
jgi:hypothetical protein